ncbi:MAG: putative toxin-antitoxin system toxin component, PIN family [Nitrospiria bacterium]
MSKFRLVLDTNVFVSGIISAEGPPAVILNAIHLRKAILLVSDPITLEYLRVLNYPNIRKYKKITDETIRDIASFLINQTERIELISSIQKSPNPDDDMFLITAVDGNADLLITGDKTDLVSLKTIETISIVSPRESLKIMKL